MDLTQSAPFENFMLLGFRRDLATMFSRGLRRSTSGLQLEDLVGTSDPSLVPDAVIKERDDIRTYAARKLLRGHHRDRIWQVLIDGLSNVIREIQLADPELLTGNWFHQTPSGEWSLKSAPYGLLHGLEQLEEKFSSPRCRPAWNLKKIKAAARASLDLSEQLLEFCKTHDPDRESVRDIGDLRSVRIALQIDPRLRKTLQSDRKPDRLLASFTSISRNQAHYDRALIELRTVYAACLSDFDFYDEFFAEILTPYRDQMPQGDYDPWYAKIFPVVAATIRQAWRSLRQRLQSG
jgi:hypothetical protein